jgi:RimJ/RimL family protein N-acetyltransferase
MTVSAVVLRPAEPADSDRLFEWVNDPDTRASSFRSERISLEEHRIWYEAALADPLRRVFIAEVPSGPAVGSVRFEPIGRDPARAEIAINLAPRQRGRGLAVPLLEAALQAALGCGLRLVVARIRSENARSVRVFEKAGFRRRGSERVLGCSALRYELRLREQASS